MKGLVLLAAALTLAGPTAVAGKGRRGVTWALSWSEAVEEAKACNVPIVVHRHGFY